MIESKKPFFSEEDVKKIPAVKESSGIDAIILKHYNKLSKRKKEQDTDLGMG